jgi:hypothetical protein
MVALQVASRMAVLLRCARSTKPQAMCVLLLFSRCAARRSQRDSGDPSTAASTTTAASDDVTAEQHMSYVQIAKAGYQEVRVFVQYLLTVLQSSVPCKLS